MVSHATYPSLRNRVVVVTGGGSGIGAALVRGFCRQGATVAFLDIDARSSEALVEECAPNLGRRPLFLECDLEDLDALRRSFTRIDTELGPVRVLVNNAANDDRHELATVTPEMWDRGLAVNLRHQFFSAQAVHRAMAAAGGGSIINMGSVGWMKANDRMAVYGAAKAAVHGLTRTLARDLGELNIRVNTVVPGWIMTERQIAKWLTPEAERAVLQRQCLKRKLVPDDVTPLVLFLASDDSAGCTAQSFFVDGGTV